MFNLFSSNDDRLEKSVRNKTKPIIVNFRYFYKTITNEGQ